MIRFKELIEKYVNIMDDETEKLKYVDDVWDMIQSSYSKIGGIQGSGFSSKEDMIKNIPFWKVYKKSGIPVAVFLYKDKNGRKRVATGTSSNLSKEERYKILEDFYKSEFGRSYSETSGAAWATIRKLVAQDKLLALAKPIEEVKKLLSKDEIIPLKDFDYTQDKDFRYNSSDPFNKFYYAREIGGKFHVKIMLGVDNIGLQNIKSL